MNRLPYASPPPSTGRLLLVANYKPDTGFAWWLMENFWVQASQVGRAQGLEPLLVYPEDGPIPQTILDANIDTQILPFPGTTRQAFRKSRELVRAENVDAVYLTDRRFTDLRYGFLRLDGVQRIINHDHTPGDRPPVAGVKGGLKALWRRTPLLSCDLQICVSPLIRERGIRNARIPADRLAVVQNGIQPLDCQGSDPTYVQQELDIPDQHRVCVMAGRAHPYKRVDFMIQVARHTRHELGLNDLTFVFCGDGPDLERLKGLAASASLGPNFIFAGPREDLDQILCSADMAIHPSQGEAFSLAIIEYMSAGLPVLVPDIPTVAQAIRQGENGFVYPDENVADAARCLQLLTEDDELRSRLGNQARRDADEKYSLSQMNETFREVMGQALMGV